MSGEIVYYYYLSAFLELVKFYLLFRFGFGISRRKKRDVTGICGAGFAFLYGCICIYKQSEVFWIYLIWAILEIILLFRYHVKDIILLGGCAVCLTGILDSLSFINLKIICVLLNWNLEQNTENLAASVMTIIFFVILFWTVLKRKTGALRKIREDCFIQILLTGFFYSILLALIWNRFLKGELSSRWSEVYKIFFILSVSAYYQLILLMKLAITNSGFQEKDRMNQKLLQLQENQYQYLKETELETRKFRHDIKNHIFVLKSLCSEKNMDKLEDYISQMWGKIDFMRARCQVGHSIVDAILNQYSFQCRGRGIHFEVKGHMPPQCAISSYDICTLFSNILQNAYEAASVCQKKEISIILRYDREYIYIQEKNTYQGDIAVRNGIFLSTKRDMVNHGFGMENIKECIHNYQGEWHYKTSVDEEGEKHFLLQIMLHNKSF